MLPRWVLDMELRDEAVNATVTYFYLCPRTPMLFLNHHWDDALPSHPRWPNQEPVYLMANIDSVELQHEYCWTPTSWSARRSSASAASQPGTCRRRSVAPLVYTTKVLLTRHSSPNPSVSLQIQGITI